MKILFIGSTQAGQTSEMRLQVLRQLGHEIAEVDSGAGWQKANAWSRRLQQASCAGPAISRLNDAVVRAAREFQPELVWAEKQEYLRADVLHDVANAGALLLHFTPDPYFTLDWKQTRLTRDAMPMYHFLVTSKRYEVEQYSRLPGRVIYMPLGFSDQVHRPVAPGTRSRYDCFASDISFLGGWEPRRERTLDEIARAHPHSLRVWGYGWGHVADGRATPRRYMSMRRNAGGKPFVIERRPVLAAAVQGGEIYAEDYAYALSSARIGLGFLRDICPDQHTTRTFEIPACGSMLLADRTVEHQEFFEEGKEAEFFGSTDELHEKLEYYLRNEHHRARIALAGFERCHRSGYSYRARIERVMQEIGV